MGSPFLIFEFWDVAGVSASTAALSARLGLCMNNLTAFSRTFCNLKGIVFAKQRSVGLVVVVPMCWLSIPKGARETATVPEIMQHCGPCSKSSREFLVNDSDASPGVL